MLILKVILGITRTIKIRFYYLKFFSIMGLDLANKKSKE